MIKLRLWQALIIFFFMIAGVIGIIDWIYKQADGIAILRVKSEIITGIKNGTPFYIKGSEIKLIPKGKRNAEITIASRRVESPTKKEE